MPIAAGCAHGRTNAKPAEIRGFWGAPMAQEGTQGIPWSQQTPRSRIEVGSLRIGSTSGPYGTQWDPPSAAGSLEIMGRLSRGRNDPARRPYFLQKNTGNQRVTQGRTGRGAAQRSRQFRAGFHDGPAGSRRAAGGDPEASVPRLLVPQPRKKRQNSAVCHRMLEQVRPSPALGNGKTLRVHGLCRVTAGDIRPLCGGRRQVNSR